MDIIISHLTKVYRGGIYGLQDLSVTIPTGMFGLLGPNGAGKTTLMRILAGILHPSSGTIRMGELDGTSREGRNALKRTLGYVPQDFGVYPDLTAEEFLHYVALLKGVDNTALRKERVKTLLETVALSDVAGRKLKTFSGGMKRRIGIAQALLNDPQLLIVDEPTAGLDPEERIRFRNLLVDLGNQRTILLSTHIVEDIAQTCSRLAVIKNGRAIFEGTTADLAQSASGKVWLMTGPTATKPDKDVVVVSSINRGAVMDYRVVGTPSSASNAVPTEPTLEDGYVWLMHNAPARAENSPKLVRS
jgi:ABC-type multidrug transport system ATPase subunit